MLECKQISSQSRRLQLTRRQLKLVLQKASAVLVKKGLVATDGSGELSVQALLQLGWLLLDGKLEVKSDERKP